MLCFLMMGPLFFFDLLYNLTYASKNVTLNEAYCSLISCINDEHVHKNHFFHICLYMVIVCILVLGS